MSEQEMVVCCAQNCPSTSFPPSDTSSPTLLHSFPRWGSRQYKLWAGMVGVWPLPAAPKLCSLHFTSDQYKRTGIIQDHTIRKEDNVKAKKLKKNALPSLFYDSDGDLFEMVPVTVPEYSDEDPAEDVTLSNVSGGLQPACTDIQGKTLDSVSFSSVSAQEKIKEGCFYHPHGHGVTCCSGSQCHVDLNSVDVNSGKIDVAAKGVSFEHSFAGDQHQVIGNLPWKERFGNHRCNFCGESFSSHLNLGSHLRVHRTLPLKCCSCGLWLPNHWKLNQHLKIHVKRCPESVGHFNASGESQEHQLGAVTSLDCKDCDRRFESRFWLGLHSQVHLPSWQRARERTLLRRKESLETRTSNESATTILQGHFSVLKQSPLFHSGDLLAKKTLSKAEMSHFSAQEYSSSDFNCTNNFMQERPKVQSNRLTLPKSCTLNFPGKTRPVLAQNSLNDEASHLSALGSKPETLKICLFDPCNSTRTLDWTNIGFVKKAYLCQEKTKMSWACDLTNKEVLQKQNVPPADQGYYELKRTILTTPTTPFNYSPRVPLRSLETRCCWDCGRRFTWPYSFILHRRKKHRRWSFSKHMRQCGQLLRSRLGLFYHEMRHIQSGYFICCHCGMSLKSGARLVRHWQGHCGNLPLLKCICGLTFRRIGNLVWHLLWNKQ